MWQEEAKCFQEVSPRCEGLQTHLNPRGLQLIAFDVHVNMTCSNIPALTTPSSEDRGETEQRGGASGSGALVGQLHLALIGCQACLYCLGQKEYPGLYPPTAPRCLFTSLSLSSSSIPSCVLAHLVRASVSARMCTDVLYCVSWHIIKGDLSERETPNRGGSVPWVFSGWHPSIPLVSVFCPQ